MGIQLVGCGLILIALVDLYLTVLYPRRGPGFLCASTNRLCWRVAKLSRVCGRNCENRVLSHAGPLMVVLDILLWGMLLWIGFAMMAYPDLGQEIQSSSKIPPPTWSTALYYAGYSLTTLGTGDLVPSTPFTRLLMVCMSALGFSFLTLSLTFFLSVYNALHRRTALALALHHRTGGTGDPAEYLARLLAGEDLTTAKTDLLLPKETSCF